MSVRTFPARLFRTKDGDTFVLEVDRGDDDTSRWTVRLKGVDTPEKGKPLATEAAQAATNYMTASNAEWPLTLVTEQTKDGSLEREKYGRYLANVVLADGTVLAEHLLADGLAKAWDGKGPHPWLILPPPLAVHVDMLVHGPDSLMGFPERHII